jgi:hypothetical protein
VNEGPLPSDWPVQRLAINSTADYELALNLITSRTEALRRHLDSPTRDLDAECGYPATVDIRDMKEMYKREGVAARVVDLMPEECWKSTPLVYEQEDPEETQFEKDWRELVGFPHMIYTKIKRADILSRIGRFGVMVLGIGDNQPLVAPARGLDEVTGQPKNAPTARVPFLYLKSYDETKVRIEDTDWETTETSPRFGWPRFYTVKMGDQTGKLIDKKIHWTRIIHLCPGALDSEVYGAPTMENVYNRLMDIRKILGGSAEMFYKGGFPGISFEINPNLQDASVNETKLKEALENYTEGLKRYIALTGISAKSLAVQVADPQGHLDAQIGAVCIAKGSPKRVFMGSERGELASSQDAKLWNERVAEHQNNYESPFVLLQLIWRLIRLGVLTAPASEEVQIHWPDLNNPTDLEKAQVALTRTQAMGTYVEKEVSRICGTENWMTIVAGYEDDEAAAMIEERNDVIDLEEKDAQEAEQAEAEAAAKAEALTARGNSARRPE